MKKILQVFAVFSLPLILSACQLISGGKNKEVTLTYWGLWESSNTITQVINDYKKIKPDVTINYVKKSPQQYREALQTQIGSGQGPDIFRFHNTWTPMLKNVLSPVPASVLSKSDFKKTFYDTVFLDLQNDNEEFVGVPLEIDGLALYWNTDIFKAAGISKPPATWNELYEDAVKLTVRDQAGNIRTAGAALGAASNVDHFSDILGLMILQNGGDPKSPTDQRSADALEYFTKFAKGPNRVWDQTLPASTVAFSGGNLAMYFGPSWRAFEIKAVNPLLKFQTAPVPQLPDAKVAVGWSNYWVEGVSAKSTHQKEAWEFVKYLQEDATLIKMYNEAAKSPGRFFGEPFPKKSMAAKLSADPLIAAYISQAPYMRSFSMASRTFDNGLNDQIIKAYEDAVNSVLSGTPAKTALSTTAKNVSTVIARYTASPAKK